MQNDNELKKNGWRGKWMEKSINERNEGEYFQVWWPPAAEWKMVNERGQERLIFFWLKIFFNFSNKAFEHFAHLSLLMCETNQPKENNQPFSYAKIAFFRIQRQMRVESFSKNVVKWSIRNRWPRANEEIFLI